MKRAVVDFTMPRCVLVFVIIVIMIAGQCSWQMFLDLSLSVFLSSMLFFSFLSVFFYFSFKG